MKKILLLCLIAMTTGMFYGCRNGKTIGDSMNDSLRLIATIDSAQHAKQTENNLFLDFKFGMSENDVMKHMEQLEKKNKIYATSDGDYQYDLNDEFGMKYKLNFQPHFYKGKLYQMVFPISSEIPSGNEYVPVALAFSNSPRSKGFKNFITKNSLGEEVYTWVNGNLIITFESNYMQYSNAPIEKIVEQEQDKNNHEKAKASSSDF